MTPNPHRWTWGDLYIIAGTAIILVALYFAARGAPSYAQIIADSRH